MDRLAKKLVQAGDLFLQKKGPQKFHVEAARLLTEAKFQSKYSFEELVQLSFKKKCESIQNYKAFEFSDLPLTLARGENCFLDLYVWRRRPTTIHNHHFMGAFQCLEGSNVDLKFSFKTKKKLGKFHSLGNLKLDETRTVTKGIVVPIDLGDKFIHQNHHHHDLTVNLCFRTPDFKAKNIANFLYSGLRYEKEQNLLMRTERLFRLLKMTSIKSKDLKLDLDDALCFLIQSFGSVSENKNFLVFREELARRVKKELKVDIDELMNFHESELDLIQANYN